MNKDFPKFPSLADFIAFAKDGEKNETGAPRTHFDLHIGEEPTHPGSAETITVLTVIPHGFDYMAQRFAMHAEDGNKLLNDEQISAFKQFKANEAAARREAAQVAHDTAAQAQQGGVAMGRIGGGQ